MLAKVLEPLYAALLISAILFHSFFFLQILFTPNSLNGLLFLLLLLFVWLVGWLLLLLLFF